MPPKKKPKVSEDEEIPQPKVIDPPKSFFKRKEERLRTIFSREPALPVYLPSQNVEIGFTAGLIPNLPDQPVYDRFPLTNTPPVAMSRLNKHLRYRENLARQEQQEQMEYDRQQAMLSKPFLRPRERPISNQTSMTIPFELSEKAEEKDLSFLTNRMNRLTIPKTPNSEDETQFKMGTGLKKRLYKLHKYIKGGLLITPPSSPSPSPSPPSSPPSRLENQITDLKQQIIAFLASTYRNTMTDLQQRYDLTQNEEMWANSEYDTTQKIETALNSNLSIEEENLYVMRLIMDYLNYAVRDPPPDFVSIDDFIMSRYEGNIN